MLLVFPVKNAKEPASLWHALYPRSAMRWDWSESADPRVVSLWHLKTELGEGDDVVYGKWYQGRATVFSKRVFTALMRIVGTPATQSRQLSLEGAQLLGLLLDDSPQTPKHLRRALDLEGRLYEAAFNRALKELWNRLLAVGKGEVDEGAYPALAIGATKLLFEDLWDEARDLSLEEAEARWREAVPAGSAFDRHLKRQLKATAR